MAASLFRFGRVAQLKKQVLARFLVKLFHRGQLTICVYSAAHCLIETRQPIVGIGFLRIEIDGVFQIALSC